ncbi:hypothetical protein U9M48_019560 [Paspalum notatum var. saurae]|uniref:Integrase zinc-binding domain-containing protein n=1 Tax=Paspalum notatum var. saurae TaxID=547442 RepID=A0AAQ3WRN3_PASNO
MSGAHFSLFDDLCAELEQNEDIGAIRDQALTGQDGWSVVDGLWIKDSKVFVPASSPLVSTIIADAHNTGHEGIQKTLHRVRATFHIHGDRSRVRDYVLSCRVCQQNKTASLRPGGLLQPLEVPSTVWADIAMLFNEGLPPTTVDRVFFAEIVRLHGIPVSIVSDRDPVFTSAFWRELFRLSGVIDQDSGYSGWLGLNTATTPLIKHHWAHHHSSIQGGVWALRSYDGSSAKLPTVDQQLKERDEFWAQILDRLEQAQQTQKAQHDRGHREVVFTPG